MSKAFEQALELTKRRPLPDDILDLLDDLREEIDADEQEDFGWFYEGVTLKTRLLSEDE